MVPSDDEFRARMREIIAHSGRSMRALSAAMGRDPGYLAALLDPARPSRARPTPADLTGLSDVTGIPLVELLGDLWGIERSRLAEELLTLGGGHVSDVRLARLSPTGRAQVNHFIDFLVARQARRGPSRQARAAHSRATSPARHPDGAE